MRPSSCFACFACFASMQLVAATGVSSPAPDNSAMLPKLLALFAHLLGPVLAFEERCEGKLAQ